MRLLRAILLHALAGAVLWPLGMVRRCGTDPVANPGIRCQQALGRFEPHCCCILCSGLG